MFYKKCNTCTNKTCIKIKSICKSMSIWLKKYIEVNRKEDLMLEGPKLDLFNYLTQGIDNKEDV